MVACTLHIGARIALVSSDGPSTAEFALFDPGDVELAQSEPGGAVREAGYRTTAVEALHRLAVAGVTLDLAEEAAASVRGRIAAGYARGPVVRRLASLLGPAELFEGGTYDASLRRYEGAWLDLPLLANDAGIASGTGLLQALALVAQLSEVPRETEVVLSTLGFSESVRLGERTLRRRAVEGVTQVPRALRGLTERAPALAAAEGRSLDDVSALIKSRLDVCVNAAARDHLHRLERSMQERTRPTSGPLSDPELWALDRQLGAGNAEVVLGLVDAREASGGREPGTIYLRARAALAVGRESPRAIALRVAALAVSMSDFPELELLAAQAWDAAGETKNALPFARDLASNPRAHDELRAAAEAILRGPRVPNEPQLGERAFEGTGADMRAIVHAPGQAQASGPPPSHPPPSSRPTGSTRVPPSPRAPSRAERFGARGESAPRPEVPPARSDLPPVRSDLPPRQSELPPALSQRPSRRPERFDPRSEPPIDLDLPRPPRAARDLESSPPPPFTRAPTPTPTPTRSSSPPGRPSSAPRSLTPPDFPGISRPPRERRSLTPPERTASPLPPRTGSGFPRPPGSMPLPPRIPASMPPPIINEPPPPTSRSRGSDSPPPSAGGRVVQPVSWPTKMKAPREQNMPPEEIERTPGRSMGRYMRGASMPPQMSEPPPAIPRAPVVPRVDIDEPELVEALVMPRGANESALSPHVIPRTPLEARIRFTLDARELGRRYRRDHGVDLRVDTRAIGVLQRHLAERFPSREVKTADEARDAELHGAALSELLARLLDAEWIDVTPSELGYWAMLVHARDGSSKRVWPFGRVLRFIATGGDDDLVGFFRRLREVG